MYDLDQTTDTAGRRFHRLVQLYGEPPEFVQAARYDEAWQVPSRLKAANSYADSVNLGFPIHTSAATWLSCLYFTDAKSAMLERDRTRIERALERAAEAFDIVTDVNRIKEAEAARVKAAAAELPDEQFAFIVTDADGHRHRALPMPDGPGVIKAANWVRDNVHTVDYATRQEVAERILERRQAIGVRLEDEDRRFLEKQAGQALCSPTRLVKFLRLKAAQVPHFPAKRTLLTNLASEFEKHANLCHEATLVDDLVKTLYVIDRDTGLNRRYDDGVSRPEEAVYSSALSDAKMAEECMVETSIGDVYDGRLLSRMSRTQLDDVFGPEAFRGQVYPDIVKLASVISVADPNTAARLRVTLMDLGVTPLLEGEARATGPETDLNQFLMAGARR